MTNDATALLALTVLSVAYTTAASSLERLRLAVSYRRVGTMLGTFTFAAVVMLPMPLLIGFVPALYAVAWPTFRRTGMKSYKWAYNAGAATVACCVASRLLHAIPRAFGLPLGVVVFMAVNFALVAAMILWEGNEQSRAMLAKRDTYLVVLGGQALGAAMGQGMQWHHVVGLLALPLLRVLHKRTAETAVKTSGSWVDRVWSRDAWMAMAEELHRGGRWFAVVVVELADVQTAASAAKVLTEFLEPGDHLGRLGAGQLVVMFDEVTANAAMDLGRMISASLAAVGVAAGVGSADCQRATVNQMLVLAVGDAVVQGANRTEV